MEASRAKGSQRRKKVTGPVNLGKVYVLRAGKVWGKSIQGWWIQSLSSWRNSISKSTLDYYQHSRNCQEEEYCGDCSCERHLCWYQTHPIILWCVLFNSFSYLPWTWHWQRKNEQGAMDPTLVVQKGHTETGCKSKETARSGDNRRQEAIALPCV